MSSHRLQNTGKILLLFTLVLVMFVALAASLAAQVADSVPGPIPPSGPINYTAAVLIGVGASLLTGVVGGVASKADSALGSVDGAIRKVIGPALPAVAAGLSIVLPMVTNAIGLSEVPDAQIVAQSPLSAIIGVTVREVARKWVLPLVRVR